MIQGKDRAELIQEARTRGGDYLRKYIGCSQATLLAVSDTLGMEVTDEMFNAVAPLSSFTGGCGGMCGAAVAFGVRFGKGKEKYLKSRGLGNLIPLLLGIQDRFEEKYSGYLCRDIQNTLYDRSFDFRVPGDREAFNVIEEEVYDKCSGVTADAAGWVVEAILDREHPGKF